jgi:predicted CopG family antitoxin
MTKTITISDDAYEVLSRNKNEGESFSDVILRLARKRTIKELAGVWGDWDYDDMKETFEEIEKGVKHA